MLYPQRQENDRANVRFESKLEQDIFDEIIKKNFHVRTQVCVGDPTNRRYRIDLVVEGMQGRLGVECDGDRWHGPDRYERDMARQRDLERAGWQFVRLRGGDFYRDRAKALMPLWTSLERLGIKPGGIDENAAEPPEPAQSSINGSEDAVETSLDERAVENGKINEVPRFEKSSSTPAKRADDGAEKAASSWQSSPTLDARNEVETVPLNNVAKENHLLARYIAFEPQSAGEDPRTVSAGQVADGLCRIIEVEGPMLAKRAYDIYLRGCGIRRMGGELRRIMNRALSAAIRQGRILSEDEHKKGGLLYSIVRTKRVAPLKLRQRGPRTYDEIPPSELLAVGRYLAERDRLDLSSDEHLRAILEAFDLKRLTTQVGTNLLEILGSKIDYVDEWLAANRQ